MQTPPRSTTTILLASGILIATAIIIHFLLMGAAEPLVGDPALGPTRLTPVLERLSRIVLVSLAALVLVATGLMAWLARRARAQAANEILGRLEAMGIEPQFEGEESERLAAALHDLERRLAAPAPDGPASRMEAPGTPGPTLREEPAAPPIESFRPAAAAGSPCETSPAVAQPQSQPFSGQVFQDHGSEIERFPSRPLRLLLVEDSENNIMLIKAFLSKAQIRVDVAENGQVGVDMFKERSYDLVLMDMQLPVMDGLTATGLMRAWENEHGGHVPIIALTSFAFKEDEERAYGAGCDFFLAKPVKKMRLLDIIYKHVL